MKRNTVCGKTVDRAPGAPGDAERRASHRRWLGLGLGLIGALIAAEWDAQPLLAQTASLPGRLTVRPRALVTGPRTVRAGDHTVTPERTQGTAAPVVYVPAQCVGPQSCPLVVFVWSWDEVTQFTVRPMADKYGLIILTPALPGDHNTVPVSRSLDATLNQVLRTFPVDPDKIAIIGTCATGLASAQIGGENTHVFSRIVALSVSLPRLPDVDPPNGTTEFFLDSESKDMFETAHELRRKGHRVTQSFAFNGHGHQMEVYDLVGNWLQKSWATPNPAARPAPAVVADPLPVLTAAAVTKMTAFWTRFRQEPDSIRTTARRAHLRQVLVPTWGKPLVALVVDVAALAAQFPTVAADLKAAGLTPQQHDAYRIALVNARLTRAAGRWAGPVDPTSVPAKNIAFMKTHPDELRALDATQMWVTP